MGSTSVALNVALALQDQTARSVLYYDLGFPEGHAERRLRTLTGQWRADAPFVERTALPQLPVRLFEARPTVCEALIAHVRRQVEAAPVSAVFLDWVQLLFGRVEEPWSAVQMSRVIGRLRELAVELQVPVVAFFTLSRDLEERVDKRPRLADFTGVGLPVESATRFAAIYRGDYYSETPLPRWTELEGHRSVRWWERCELLCWRASSTRAEVHSLPFHPPTGRVRWR
jgi:hypothetical protein